MSHDGRPRRALATIGSGPLAPALRLSVRRLRPYAERHGYHLVVGDGIEPNDRPPAWQKIPLIRRLLEDHDEVLWIDADVVILDPAVDIASTVSADAFQALAEPTVPFSAKNGKQDGLNSGVWLLRGPRAVKFLDAVWEQTEFLHHQLWENAALLDLLGYDIDESLSARRTRPSTWWDGTSVLDPEWNSLVYYGLQGGRFRHYAGLLPYSRRLRWMAVDVDGRAQHPVAAIHRWLRVGAARNRTVPFFGTLGVFFDKIRGLARRLKHLAC